MEGVRRAEEKLHAGGDDAGLFLLPFLTWVLSNWLVWK